MFFALPVSLPTTLEDAHVELIKTHARIVSITTENETLRQQIAILKKHLFGRSSEKRVLEVEQDGSQFDLLADHAETPEEATGQEAAEEITIPEHKRRKRGGRRPLPKELPRVQIVHDVTDEDKVCECCGGEKHIMSRDVTEQIEIVPAKIYIAEHVRIKRTCRCPGASIVQAPVPTQPIPRSIAGPSFLAYMIVSKYADHIPLCRMERILARSGIDITRSNMSEWVMRLHQLCKVLVVLMMKRLLNSAVINSDDTSIHVQRKGGTKRCCLWVYLGDDSAPYTIFDFREGRSRAGPNEVLANYSGFLQTDAYAGYGDCCRWKDENGRQRIVPAGCWAHARRRFVEAMDGGDERTKHAVESIRECYRVERMLREENADADRRLAVRREQSLPVLNKLETWMNERLDVRPKSPLGSAIGYAQDNWQELLRFTEDGRIAIDNNAAERAIRPVAVGRKNWLFAGSEQGGHAAATFFTLIESAKRHGLNPFEYLHDLFVRLPDHNMQKLDELLPDKWQPATRSPLETEVP